MAVPFWGFDPPNDVAEEFASLSPWDAIYFGGMQAPGIPQVRARRAHRSDVRSSPGDSANQITHLGPVPAEVDVMLLLWTSAQWRLWQQMVEYIFPTPGKNAKSTSRGPQAIQVDHPALQAYRITSLYCLEIGVPEIGPVPGSRIIALRFVEFRPTPGGTFTQPDQAQVSLQSQINTTADYSGTSSPTSAPSATQTGP